MALHTSKKQRLRNGATTSPATIPLPRVFPNDPSTAATDEDKGNWNGFCEIESEPAFFNVMLKQFGVKGVKVQEVVSLDEDLLAYLPRPVYGLIFLFRWREDDPIEQESSCPPNIWFANQTVENACASIALLNIVYNIPEIHLGEHLQQFKEFTLNFTPALRGDSIGNFEFIKQIHNSFARKIDMLNGDLFLKNGATVSRRSKKWNQGKGDCSDTSFHFIAFVPIDGKVWKLDGLERQPQSIGVIKDDDWLGQAKPEIKARMEDYGDGQIEFAVLSLVKDPLLDLVPRLAANVKSLQAISARLDQVRPDWQDFIIEDGEEARWIYDGRITGPHEAYNLTVELIETAVLPEAMRHMLLDGSRTADLITCLQGLVKLQRDLRKSIKTEIDSNRRDEGRAAGRRHDYSPLIQSWIRAHARRGVIRTVIEHDTLWR